MKIYHIAALSENNVIAKNGKIPWVIKDDLKRFREITLTHPIIMGRKTYDSFPHPLPNRPNIVLSRGGPDHSEYDSEEDSVLEFNVENTTVAYARKIPEALDYCKEKGKNEIYIIGGGEIYKQTLDLVDELRLTIIHKKIEEDGDCVYYPELDLDSEWMQTYTNPSDTHSYIDYVRRT